MLVHNVLYGCQNGSNKPFPNLSHYLLSLSKVNLNSKNNGPILLFKTMQQLAKGDISHVIVDKQGAKKIIFTACHSGKLNLTFTSPDVISTSPKSFLRSGFFCYSNSSKKSTCHSGKLKTEFTRPIAKSTILGYRTLLSLHAG